MNLNALLAECYRRLNFTATPQAAVTSRLTGFVNDAHRRLLVSPGMEKLRDATVNITTVPGYRRMGLPPGVARINRITDLTNGLVLRALEQGDYRALSAGTPVTAFTPLVTGTPDSYVHTGFSQVSSQPFWAAGYDGTVLPIATGVDKVYVGSTSPADTTQTVFLSWVTQGGYAASASAVLTGTTAVEFGTALPAPPGTWVTSDTFVSAVVRFSLSASCAGYVGLSVSKLGSNQIAWTPPPLAIIEPTHLATSYQQIDFYPIPAAAATYAVDFTRSISDLVNPSDVPYLPDDFHYLLVVMACRREYGFADDNQRYVAMAQEEQQAIRALRAWVLYPPDYRVRDMGDEGQSNLGGAFPSGRW